MNDTATSAAPAPVPVSAATPTGAAPAQAAPTGAAPAGKLSWDQIVANAGTDAAGAPGQQAAAAPQTTSWDAAKPKGEIKSMRDRLSAKLTRTEGAVQQTQAQLQAAQARAQQLEASLAQQQHADARYQQLLEAGDIDGALKVKGLGPFSELQQQVLRAKGALPPRDPRVEALERELQGFRAEKQQTVEQQRRAQAEAAARAEWDNDIQETIAEIASLPHEGAQELSGTLGFGESVLRAMVNDQNLTTAQAAAMVRSEYEALYQELHKVFGSRQAAAASQPVQPGVLAASLPSHQGVIGAQQVPQVPTTLSQRAAGDAQAPDIDPSLRGEDRWKAIRARAERM